LTKINVAKDGRSTAEASSAPQAAKKAEKKTKPKKKTTEVPKTKDDVDNMGNSVAPCSGGSRQKGSEQRASDIDPEDDMKVDFGERKKRAPVYGGGLDDLKDEEDNSPNYEHTTEEIEFLLDKTSSNLMFMGLDKDMKVEIIKQMYKENVPKGKEIIVQGDKGTTFYVIVKGKFDIVVDGSTVASFDKGKCFGELALMYNAPRAATVKATVDSEVFTVHRRAFRKALRAAVRTAQSRNMKFLKSIPEFAKLEEADIKAIDGALVPYEFEQGEVVLRQGEEGDRFYLIISGAATWTKVDGPNKSKQSGDLGLGKYFGERALLKKQKRAATITAKTKLRTLTLSKEDFDLVVTPHQAVFNDRLKSYEKPQDGKKGRNKSAAPRQAKVKKEVSALKDLQTIGLLGKGAFGIVSLVFDKATDESYALKSIKKCQIVELGQQKHIVNEMQIMKVLSEEPSTFLVNLVATYKDRLRVYFLLDVCLGGELFTILRHRRNFPESTARFFAACVIEAFHFMHSRDVIYRDLKPENLVLDNNGYLKITDFGFAKECPEKTFTLCGTPDYLAPEIVTGQGHGKPVDWWTLGILLYEMTASFPPFYDEQPINTYRKIIKGKVKFPRYFSEEVKEIIKNLLRVRPVKRLGILKGGTELIRRSKFYSGFDWQGLNNGKMEAPIKNKVKNPKDLSNFEKVKLKNDKATPVKPEDDFDELF